MNAFLAICVLLAIGSAECGFGAFGGGAVGAPAPVADAKGVGLDAALSPMDDELSKESALGGPVNTAGLQKASDLTAGVAAMDDVSAAADLGAEASDFTGFAASAKKPDSTGVDVPAPAAGPAAPAPPAKK
ncbi:hypothetical protein JTE90_012901 [Oedothorax gibbosus]|uniref:Uncharacterized protein n=1 Tax=Oedothorax gibbosus TaxID=931172 RepID=A0AAV6U0G1_9ARAC|nr:hypothetical protein JTE90_012901 [Oedothorax gibbosus]KAG8177780.1 hypothetical protein JTE90_012901 [Oedothorax gibbosus]